MLAALQDAKAVANLCDSKRLLSNSLLAKPGFPSLTVHTKLHEIVHSHEIRSQPVCTPVVSGLAVARRWLPHKHTALTSSSKAVPVSTAKKKKNLSHSSITVEAA